jgi:hypothetical protein
MISGKAKEALMTPSEDDPFDNQDDTPSVFSQTLSKFKRPPKKKGRLRYHRPRIYGRITVQLQPVVRGPQMTTTTSLLSLTTVKTTSRRALLVLPSALLANPF